MVIDVSLMYYYTGVLFVVLRKGWVLYTILFAGTCRDAHERSATNKPIWECCISYSTSIGVVFRSLKTTGGWFQQVETDVDFIISDISSIFNDNC